MPIAGRVRRRYADVSHVEVTSRVVGVVASANAGTAVPSKTCSSIISSLAREAAPAGLQILSYCAERVIGGNPPRCFRPALGCSRDNPCHGHDQPAEVTRERPGPV